MRFIRLRVANYRGITRAEVAFGPSGITLVQGPNEAGKSSLREAVGLLFDYPDNSRHRRIDAVKPVHRDEGPEVELEAESGAYAFTYFKRFTKRPETRLTVRAPRPENLTGREAHDRALAILQETLDYDLWRALIIEQGDAIRQPELGSQRSLSAALDRASGGRPADPREDSLFDKVRAEYLAYFTGERGAEKRELADARQALADGEAAAAALRQALGELEADAERAAALGRELAQLERQEAELAREQAAHAADLEEIERLEKACSEAGLRLQTAQKSEQVAGRDLKERGALIEAADRAAAELDRLEKADAESRPALTRAETGLKEAQRAFGEADGRRKEAEAHAARRRDDFDFFNNQLNLDQLRERQGRIDAARASAGQAEAELARNKVTDRALKAIQEAERGLLEAAARQRTEAPEVTLRGLAAVQLDVDGREVRLEKGGTRTLAVTETTRLALPGVLEVEIAAGAGAGAMVREVEEARRILAAACAKAGVADPEAARQAFEDRREARRVADAVGQVEKDNLRDLTYDELDRKVRGLAAAVADYRAKRPADPPMAADLGAAKRERAEAETRLKEAAGRWESAQAALEAARGVWDELNAEHQARRVQRELFAGERDKANGSLERARAAAADDALTAALEAAERAVADTAAAVRAAETSLQAKNPDKVRALAETAAGSLRTVQQRRAAAQTELTEVRTRLKIRGEEGLHEKLRQAEIDLERRRAETGALLRRAAAARCLFETMREEREKARRAYVAPLKEKIEGLGRLVFDPTFGVEVSEELRIESRTLGGVTVPFDSLSGGTREQLSLVFRAACAMIVAGEGGMPLILDDALGYTDPERLRLMGAVLARAARECQIVIFTCLPDRYAAIGDATVVAI